MWSYHHLTIESRNCFATARQRYIKAFSPQILGVLVPNIPIGSRPNSHNLNRFPGRQLARQLIPNCCIEKQPLRSDDVKNISAATLVVSVVGVDTRGIVGNWSLARGTSMMD